MPQLTITWDPRELYAGLIALKEDQVPFALSQTLNEAAKLFQAAERRGIAARFTLRRPDFILNGVWISHFSNKRDSPLYVQVEIEPRRDFLYKFEPGETKVPRGAHLAIPIDARPGIGAIVPAELRPKALGLAAHTTKSGAEQWKGAQRTFLLTLANGDPAIMQRTGPKPTDVRVLFTMKTSAPTPASLHFQDTARGTILEAIDRNFPRFFRAAMRTAR